MSNRRKPDPTPQQSLPPVPAPYCTQYQYNVDADGVVTIWGAQGGRWHTGMALPLRLAVDLHQKLGETLAAVIRNRAAQPDPSAQEPPQDGQD